MLNILHKMVNIVMYSLQHVYVRISVNNCTFYIVPSITVPLCCILRQFCVTFAFSRCEGAR